MDENAIKTEIIELLATKVQYSPQVQGLIVHSAVDAIYDVLKRESNHHSGIELSIFFTGGGLEGTQINVVGKKDGVAFDKSTIQVSTLDVEKCGDVADLIEINVAEISKSISKIMYGKTVR